MASNHGRGKGYSPEPYHFFKVILESTIRDGKLGIPRKFARDYGNTLSSPVFFEFPNGEMWELELTKLEDEMWVQNGWRKFAEHYSLELGHFLVFRYEGNCRFHVLIFDRSASEIHYPYANGKEGIHQQVKIEEPEEDDSLQIINNFSTGMREKLVLQCPRPLKVKSVSKNGFSSGKGETKKVKSYEKSKALMRASCAFKSENPFFLVFMQPTYVDVGSDSKRSCHVCIPREFSRKYLMDHGDVILNDSNGNTWSAEYRSIHGTKQPYTKLCNGWGAFVRDNNLHVGDVCIFELIDCIDIAFRVTIYGGNHGSPAKMEAGISSTHQECLLPLKVHALELPSEEYLEVDDNQLGTSRLQIGEDGLNSEKKEYSAYPEPNTLLFSKNKMTFEKGKPTKISLDVISRRGRSRVGCKLPVTALSSLLPPSSCFGYSPRHGEHVLEANENTNWAACHGICNCSFCLQAKGWAPPGPLTTKISKTGFSSVTHDLIQSSYAHTDMENNSDNTDQVSAKRSMSFPAPALPLGDSREMDDNQLVTSKPQSGDKIDDGKDLNFTNKETGGCPLTLENIPKRKRALSIESSADSIAGRLRQRRTRRKDTSHHDSTGVKGEALDGSSKNADEGCTATEKSSKLMKRPASGMENAFCSNAARPKQSRERGNVNDKQGSPGANDNASGKTAENTSSRKKSKTNMKHSTSGTNMDCIARRLRPRNKAL